MTCRRTITQYETSQIELITVETAKQMRRANMRQQYGYLSGLALPLTRDVQLLFDTLRTLLTTAYVGGICR